jgi:hypothetical protein
LSGGRPVEKSLITYRADGSPWFTASNSKSASCECCEAATRLLQSITDARKRVAVTNDPLMADGLLDSSPERIHARSSVFGGVSEAIGRSGFVQCGAPWSGLARIRHDDMVAE